MFSIFSLFFFLFFFFFFFFPPLFFFFFVSGDELIDCESNEGELFTVELATSPFGEAGVGVNPSEEQGSGGDASDRGADQESTGGGGGRGEDDKDDEDEDEDGDGDEETAYPKVLIDAFTLIEGSMFVVDVHGQLLEHARSERLWINHGQPALHVRYFFYIHFIIHSQ